MVHAMTEKKFSNAGLVLHTIHLVVMNSIFQQSDGQSMMWRARN